MESESERGLIVKPGVVDALLGGGDLRRPLSRTGFSKAQVSEVMAVRAAEIDDFKLLERDHARTVSVDTGGYIVIAPFPRQREEWLSRLEQTSPP